MKKFILLNGPPRSGKDTAASILLETISSSRLYKMTSPMDNTFKALFGISNEEWNYYREVNKDQKHKIFGGHTTRDALIAFSEEFAKPLFGASFFGDLAAIHTDKIKEDVIVVSDTGFEHEVKPLLKKYGPENFLLIRLTRDNCFFSGDSRNYIKLKKVRTLDIRNTDLESFKTEVIYEVDSWLKK